MKIKANTNTLGGGTVLAISAFFYFQLGDDFSPYGTYFPERILPILVILGVLLIVIGVLKKNESRKTIFEINNTMLTAMIVGAFWAIFLVFFGFILSTFVSLSVLIVAYMENKNRTRLEIVKNLLGVFVVDLIFYYSFSRFLGVMLPVGKIFSLLK